MWLFKKFLSFFLSFFHVIEENSQLNIIKSIYKDAQGLTQVEIAPIDESKSYAMYPYQILKDQLIANLFRPKDRKLIEAILFTEGDVFVTEKEYTNDTEIYVLKSLIDKQSWRLSAEQIKLDELLFNRLNKRYFDFKISLKLDTKTGI